MKSRVLITWAEQCCQENSGAVPADHRSFICLWWWGEMHQQQPMLKNQLLQLQLNHWMFRINTWRRTRLRQQLFHDWRSSSFYQQLSTGGGALAEDVGGTDTQSPMAAAFFFPAQHQLPCSLPARFHKKKHQISGQFQLSPINFLHSINVDDDINRGDRGYMVHQCYFWKYILFNCY